MCFLILLTRHSRNPTNPQSHKPAIPIRQYNNPVRLSVYIIVFIIWRLIIYDIIIHDMKFLWVSFNSYLQLNEAIVSVKLKKEALKYVHRGNRG